MTKEQLHILQHSLGVDQYGQGNMYRNHYVGGANECRLLVAMGYMLECKPRSISGGDVWFVVTDAGEKAMREESPKPPKKSRAAQRFAEYRSYADAFDCTFRQWLDIRKTDWYKEMKAHG